MSFADHLQSRLYQLALKSIQFCRTLPRTAEGMEWAGQLRRASTAASANYRAARRGRSRNEWRAKLGVVIEELDEADHWLSIIGDAGLRDPPQDLITECRQLRAILAKCRATSRRKRPAQPPERKKRQRRKPSG